MTDALRDPEGQDQETRSRARPPESSSIRPSRSSPTRATSIAAASWAPSGPSKIAQAPSGVEALLQKGRVSYFQGDLAKAWSFYEFLATEGGKPGQLWLRTCCDLHADNGLQLSSLRAKCEESFGVKDDDVFRVLDERWKKHAQELLKKGAEAPKR